MNDVGIGDTTVLVRRLDVTTRVTEQVAERSSHSADGFLLETLVGRYVLNDDARKVWLLIDGARSVADIAAEIACAAALPVREVEEPLHQLCVRLADLGLIEVASNAAASGPALRNE